ncbi:hypothetical protein DCAR_0311100 [Daucus carota subsp. sativus]|uniref:Ubiquitin-like protease family profile domain-containing protein n=1 Tax=Daucus carota subsp. sativus TaxID=79200 RepID=A0AAF1ATJ9_DAUCS|nr:hypothetical protein DCAR_0311100 [Daucus carota subsp. sativus]
MMIWKNLIHLNINLLIKKNQRLWIKIETEVVRTIPRFTAWSDKDLRARERKETSENLFGKGRIRSADESTEQTQEVDRNLDEERKRGPRNGKQRKCCWDSNGGYKVNKNHMTVSDHHYLLCFNIKKPSFEVIDSSALQPDFDAKYQQIPQNIRNFLVRYMVLKNHSKAKDIASLVPVRLEMKWRTEHNHIDCGLFVMRHMEHYQGVSKNWDCGLAVEGKVQDQQLDVLRTRYAHQILMHECNKQKHHVEYQIFEEHVKKAELEKQKAKEKKEKDTKAPAKRQRRA